MFKFRDLTAEEIDCRVSTCSEKGVSLLLYKDARCDMIILDETVGPLNWQRRHTRENANCIVEIWDDEKKQWIAKEDTGTESYTEKEKGQASDSFKRACFNWGIGRELYTAPFIWVNASDCNMKQDQKTGKWTTFDKFEVVELGISDKHITSLVISNKKTGKIVYTYGNTKTKKSSNSSNTTNEVISPICPVCGKPVKGFKRESGEIVTGETVLRQIGMCLDCNKKRNDAEKK